MAEFLLEIGLEEVPARMLAAAETELRERVLALLVRERLLDAGSSARSYATPRRLAVAVQGVNPAQPDTEDLLTGPAVSVAFKDGVPGPAALAFAKKAGLAVDALQQVNTAKGLYLSARVQRQGRSAAAVLAELLPAELAGLAWPKSMYWRAGKPERFVRPVKWLLALLDEDVVPVEFAGVQAGRNSYGHRVLFGSQPVSIEHPARYEEALKDASVMADAATRRHTIRKALDRVTRTVPGARWREDEALVETVTYLTEWPTVLLGGFAPEFLALPEEVLVTVMRDHQKYFAVEDTEGRLAPHFLAVLNTAADQPGEAIIRHGNERVLRARFSDAQFFWNFDQRVPLAERTGMLESVTFQKDLGSYATKTERTRAIASALATLVEQRGVALDRAALDRAATLAKTDLTTELVKEFTELQGVVGGLYAAAQAEPGNTSAQRAAQAIYWQYMPASIGDAIPPTVEGQILGLADRIGSITDLFAIGLEPTGSSDPYALRRAGNSIVKILAEGETSLLLSKVALAGAKESSTGGNEAVVFFLLQRVRSYLQEVRGFSYDVVRAMPLLYGSEHGELAIQDLAERCKALTEVRGTEEFAAISSALKRTRNILRQAREKSIAVAKFVEPAQLTDNAERELYESVTTLKPTLLTLTSNRDYQAALNAIATLRPKVDTFFEKVMVMVEEPTLRANRLALLSLIDSELVAVADLSELDSQA